MDVRIVSAGRGENAVVVTGVGDLLADVHEGAVYDCVSRAVDEAVDERGARVLEDLLDPAGELVRGLRPVVVFYRDDENRLDLLRIDVGAAQTSEKGERAERAGPSHMRH